MTPLGFTPNLPAHETVENSRVLLATLGTARALSAGHGYNSQIRRTVRVAIQHRTERAGLGVHREACGRKASEFLRRHPAVSPIGARESCGRLRAVLAHDNAKFVRTALGSLAESQNHLKDALKEGYVTQEEFSVMWRLARRAFGAATGWHQYLKSCPPGDPSKWLHTPGTIKDDAPAAQNPEPKTPEPFERRPPNPLNPEP